jgi:ActR/RegA family two-component response regulator
VLNEFGLQPTLAETLDEAKALLAREETALAFVQPRFSDGSFQEVLGAGDGPRPRIPVIICSAFYDKNLYIEAMTLGAFDYLFNPADWNGTEPLSFRIRVRDARALCQVFFSWYSTARHHGGVGLMAPAMLHGGEGEAITQVPKLTL